MKEGEEDQYEFALNQKSSSDINRILPVVDSYADIRRMSKSFKETKPGEFTVVASNFESFLTEIKSLLDCRDSQDKTKRGHYRSGKNLSLALRLLLSSYKIKTDVLTILRSADKADDITTDLPNFSVNALKNLFDLHGSSRHNINVRFLLEVMKRFSVDFLA